VTVPLVVLDTNVLVSAIRSKRGASFALLELVGTDHFDIALSVPVVLEYEDAMLRHRGSLAPADIRGIIDYLCSVGVRQRIFFLWRPLLRDSRDDMVVELAVAAQASTIVTHNLRHFRGAETLGIHVLSPGDFLKRIRSR
jgi:putative PIN family toxin of toxin-antitoxin system